RGGPRRTRAPRRPRRLRRRRRRLPPEDARMSALVTIGALPLAITKQGVGNYVSALFAVYTILILLNILISFVPRMPYHPWLRAVLDFITETTDPYLNIFRSIMRPLGGAGGFAFDLSPILAIIVLGLAEGIVVGALS